MNQTTKTNIRGSAAFTLIGGIVILLATLFLLIRLASSGYFSDVEETTVQAVTTRIKPAGSITMGDGVPVGMRTGEKIFQKVCAQCHAADSSVANAPKITNNAEWAPRIAQGFDTLFDHALNGFNAMPAKGGDTSLTDDELKRAIAHMTNQSGGKFDAPPVSAAASGAASSASAAAPSAGSDAAAPTTAGGGDDVGKKVFDSSCMACHSATSAIPNVPRITKNDEWAPRIKKGKETLFKHAIEGFNDKGVMPPKGGNAGLSDDEVKAAVTYMVNQSGGKL